MNKNIIEAYSLLEKVTPFRTDCGKLCGSCCCKGGSNDGMELFFGEEELLKNVDGFNIIESHGRKILVCGGKCDRKMRPLSCRIYPLFPLVDESGKINVVYDVRGAVSCPMVKNMIKPDYGFVRAVRKAARWLIRDERNLQILRETSELFAELIKLNEKLK